MKEEDVLAVIDDPSKSKENAAPNPKPKSKAK